MRNIATYALLNRWGVKEVIGLLSGMLSDIRKIDFLLPRYDTFYMGDVDEGPYEYLPLYVQLFR